MLFSSSPAALFAAVLLFASCSSAQILPSTASATFPACAFDCTSLQEAQTLCLPPNTAAANEQSCFCASSYLVSYKSSSDGPCDTICTDPGDRSLLQAWYLNYCATPVSTSSSTSSSSAPSSPVSSSPNSVTTTFVTSTSSILTIVAPTDSSAATQTSTSNVNSAPSATPSTAKEGWFSTHWRWILMLILLVVGLSLLAILAVYLKRRHRRKVERRRAAASGFAETDPKQDRQASTASHGQDMWGPHQHMAATKGWEYTHDQDEALANGEAGALGGRREKKKRSRRVRRGDSGKGKERDVAGVKEVYGTVGEMRELNTDYATRAGGRRRSPRRRDTDRDRDRYTDGSLEYQMRGGVMPPDSRDGMGDDDEFEKI